MTDLPGLLARLLDPPHPHSRALTLLARCGGLQRLRRLSPSELTRSGFVNETEARRLHAAFQLAPAAYLSAPVSSLTEPSQLVAALPSLSAASSEEIWVVPVDAGLRPLEFRQLAVGGPASCVVRIGEVLGRVVASRGSAFLMAHNHPSGDPTPSERDLAFTEATADKARLLQVELLDHVVVAGFRWHSCVSGLRGHADGLTRRSSAAPRHVARRP